RGQGDVRGWAHRHRSRQREDPDGGPRDVSGGPVSRSDAASPLLEVQEITVRFGALFALSAVSLAIRRGEVLAIIGPNGAGKTTLLNANSGFSPPPPRHLGL